MKTISPSFLRPIVLISSIFYFIILGIPNASQAQNQVVTNTLDAGAGSLRQAILNANSNPGPDSISFSLAGVPPFIITPLTAFPHVSDSLTVIDGTTQPGYQKGDIRIDCSSLPAWTTGLYVDQTASYFELYGIYMYGGTYEGLHIDAMRGSIIGAPGKGNIISGFDYHGIMIAAHRSLGVTVQSNIIGLQPDGITPQANDRTGIYVAPYSGSIGGTFQIGGSRSAEEGNLIGNNGFAQLILGARGIVQGNTMGTDASMTLNFANGWNIISGFNLNCISVSSGADSCLIGGASSDLGNILANSPANAVIIQGQTQATICNNTMLACGGTSTAFGGVSVHGSTSVHISRNSMFCNAVGIAHLASGNNNKAAPIIATASELSIVGSASPGDSIEVFAHDTTGCSGANCQGGVFLGGTRADPSGQWSINGYFPYALEEATATATDSSGNTSRFSACRIIDAVLAEPEEEVLSLEEVEAISMYPNPSHGELFIQMPPHSSLEHCNIHLFSMTNQAIRQEVQFEIDEFKKLLLIDLGEFPTGIYVVQLISEELIWRRKLVIK